jgi:sterol desaturase/sphingolipid hydroxylase (fatty acid hydroxylase superfamily)
MSYVAWLAVISVVVVVAERIRPRRTMPLLRRALFTDLAYVVLNGHFVGLALAYVTTPLALRFDGLLDLHVDVAREWPLGLQLVVALVVVDFAQWCIHNLMHRVPFLWEMHKVHHSIVDLDWMGSMRFHVGEIVVYKALQYPLLAIFGFSSEVLFVLAVVGTAIGHFNHANLDVDIGPLRYVLNNPRMHVWHHARPDDGSVPMINFGINLSLWDWLFRTAHLEKAPPARLGFDGIEHFPTTLPGQELHPFPVERSVRAFIGR